MAAIKDLLQQISDPALKERLLVEIDRLKKNKKFGLVFEEHVPECTPLYGVPIRRNSTVARKIGKVSDIFTVKNIDGENAECVNKATQVTEYIPIAELVSVAQFGEPIFPSLEPIAKVKNAPIDEHEVHHLRTLLEELFTEAYIQMATIVINQKGVSQGRLARTEEYAIYVFMPQMHSMLPRCTKRNERKSKHVVRSEI